VVYHETITKRSEVFESKTPNKHNKFKIFVEPIPKDVLEQIIDKGINTKIRPKDKEIVEKLIECGIDRDVAKKTLQKKPGLCLTKTYWLTQHEE